MKEQIHVYYSGRVQGVGFRFTAGDIARELGITGWAKNLRDGRVEVIAEAEEKVVEDFLARIIECFSRYIQDTEITRGPATGEFKDFSIKY